MTRQHNKCLGVGLSYDGKRVAIGHMRDGHSKIKVLAEYEWRDAAELVMAVDAIITAIAAREGVTQEDVELVYQQRYDQAVAQIKERLGQQ